MIIETDKVLTNEPQDVMVAAKMSLLVLIELIEAMKLCDNEGI